MVMSALWIDIYIENKNVLVIKHDPAEKLV